MTLYIRERAPDELPIQVDIGNSARPPDWHTTVEEALAWESLVRPEDKVMRLLAFEDERPVGAGGAFHGVFEAPGRFDVSIAVRPEFQRRGIAKALYEQLVSFAHDQEANELECGVREWELPKLEGWLDREGYREVSRMRESELRLDEFDFEKHAAAVDRAVEEGISFTTLAEEDTEENRRKLYELVVLTDRDVPFDVPHPDEPYDRFRNDLDAPHCLRDCLVIARDGERYAGYTMLGRRSPDRVLTWGTGVHPDYRGRGLAFAIKVRSAQLARDRGYQAMRTYNHQNNPAMLAVNNRLGYTPLPELVNFVKPL